MNVKKIVFKEETSNIVIVIATIETMLCSDKDIKVSISKRGLLPFNLANGNTIINYKPFDVFMELYRDKGIKELIINK